MVVENTVSGTTPESPISGQLGWDQMTETAMAYGLYSFHAHQTTRALWMGALSSYGGIAMVAKIMACPAFLYMTLSTMGC